MSATVREIPFRVRRYRDGKREAWAHFRLQIRIAWRELRAEIERLKVRRMRGQLR